MCCLTKYICALRKRQHRLEEQQADIEWQIRCLFQKPNRGEEEVRQEEELIARCVILDNSLVLFINNNVVIGWWRLWSNATKLLIVWKWTANVRQTKTRVSVNACSCFLMVSLTSKYSFQ